MAERLNGNVVMARDELCALVEDAHRSAYLRKGRVYETIVAALLEHRDVILTALGGQYDGVIPVIRNVTGEAVTRTDYDQRTALEVLIDAKLAGVKSTTSAQVQTPEGSIDVTYAFRSNEQAAGIAIKALHDAGFKIVYNSDSEYAPVAHAPTCDAGYAHSDPVWPETDTGADCLTPAVDPAS